MERNSSSIVGALGLLAAALAPACWAAGGIQVGPSGKTYASSSLECAAHPVAGWSPKVQAGLYAPRKNARGSVSLDGAVVATVTYASPDATVWLANGVNHVSVLASPGHRAADHYVFDASLTFPGQPNVCIPDTRGNTVAGDLEYAQSQKSYATVSPGCALDPQTGRARPFVNLFDNGAYLLNVSVDGVALTQLDGRTRTHTPVFLGAGLNVISAANGTLSTDYYVRDGGSGSCQLP